MKNSGSDCKIILIKRTNSIIPPINVIMCNIPPIYWKLQKIPVFQTFCVKKHPYRQHPFGVPLNPKKKRKKWINKEGQVLQFIFLSLIKSTQNQCILYFPHFITCHHFISSIHGCKRFILSFDRLPFLGSSVF